MDRVIDLSAGIPLGRNQQQSLKQVTEDEMRLSLVDQMIQDTTLRLWEAEFEDGFMEFLNNEAISFASEDYQKIQTEQPDVISDTVIYYDQKLEYLKLQRAVLMEGMKG